MRATTTNLIFRLPFENLHRIEYYRFSKPGRFDDDENLIVVTVTKPVKETWPHSVAIKWRIIVPELVKLLANNKAATLNSVGLLLTIVGAGLVFRYGMSYLVRTGGYPIRIVMGPDPELINMERWHDRLALLGLIYVGIGTFYQVIANWL
jgi:hypothetical protein